MNAKHTPGPWMRTAISAGGTVNVILAASSRTESNVIARDILPHNADLIAAAPETATERDRLREVNADLLAALRRIDKLNGSTGGAPSLVAEFKFIARAEGR